MTAKKDRRKYTPASMAKRPDEHATLTIEVQRRWHCSNCKQVGEWATSTPLEVVRQFEWHLAERHPDLE